MPVKPTKQAIENGKKKLDPKAVLTAIINDIPALREKLIAEGLVEEIKKD